jgi:ELWxxDGT repeat protein
MLVLVRSLTSLSPRSFAAWLVLASAATGQKLEVVDDINKEPGGVLYHERQVVELGGWLYFVRDDAAVGVELYRCDVATNALELVSDIAPGAAGSRPDWLTVYGGALYFAADDGVHGMELWRSDGTAAGTQLVVDIRPGFASSITIDPYQRKPIAIAGGELYFAANGGSGGVRLWHSDGTAAGTAPVTFSGATPVEIASDGTSVYYRAGTTQLCKATAGSSTVLKTFASGPWYSGVHNGALYFAGAETGSNYELWKSDGTVAGTVLLKDINPSQGSYPGSFTSVGAKLYFSADNGAIGRELYVTDGTSAGTTLVADIVPGVGGFASGVLTSVYRRFTVFQGVLYFPGGDLDGPTLWRSDGSAAGTYPVVAGAVAPTLEWDNAMPESDVAGSVFFFAGRDAAHGTELWSCDGSAAGTALVADLEPGPESTWPRMYAEDGVGGIACISGPLIEPSLCHSGGSAATTALVADDVLADTPHTEHGEPMGVLDLFGRVLVGAYEPSVGRELWSGSAGAGLELVADINPGAATAFLQGAIEGAWWVPFEGLRLGTRVIFLAHSNDKVTLWVTDGTPAGTQLVREFGAWWANDAEIQGVALDTSVVFAVREPSGSGGLWRSDGTVAGTTQLLPIAAFSGARIARLGNRAVVALKGNPNSLWTTDGTLAGTRLLHNSGSTAWLGGQWIATVGDRVYFPAGTTSTGVELWSTDGTMPGTQLVADIRAGSVGSDPQWLTRHGDELYFSADDGVNGRKLWRSDGTAAGTQLAAGTSSPLQPRELSPLGSKLVFAAGSVLYAHSQGAISVLKGFNAQCKELTAIGSRRVYFSGTSTLGNAELWSTDGTAAGTLLFEELYPGTTGSDPGSIAVSDGKLYVAADDGVVGLELRYANVGALAHALGSGCAASGRVPDLSADDPLIGGATTLRVRDAGPALAGVVMMGAKAAPLLLGSGCEIVLDPLSAQSLTGLVTDASGKWTSASLSIPNDPSLIDAQIVLQAVLGPSATQPLSFDLSNGVLLTLQSF